MRGMLFAALSGANALVSGPNYSIPPSLPDVITESAQLADLICGKLPPPASDSASIAEKAWVREEANRILDCRADTVKKYLERRPKQ